MFILGVNILCGLIAYSYQPKKPSLNRETDLAQYASPELRLDNKIAANKQ